MLGHRSGRMRGALGALALGALLASLAPALAGGATLPDGRAWEMVSPVDKGGASVAVAGAISGGGLLQAAADGNSVTYGSAGAFGPDAQGAPPGSQYLSVRGATGWGTGDLSAPLFSGTYGSEEGVPYKLFSPDLARGLISAGRGCRSSAGECPVANPPLPGTAAPAGYENYYLRTGDSFEALLSAADLTNTDVGPAHFEVILAGASADLGHVVMSSCAALTPDATEVPLGEGCNPTAQNLYERSASGLSLINAAPGAALAAPAGAVSADGGRVYFTATGNLYLREGAQVKQVDSGAGGGGTFQTATADGSVAFFSKGGHLYRYDATADTDVDLTPAGGVIGVLGAAADGSYVYYLDGGGLFVYHGGAAIKVAAAADPSDYPPATGTARVSADGTHLAFLSKVSLTGYDNTDQKTGLPDTEVFVYSTTGGLRCASCRPSGVRPVGSSTIPGAAANGTRPGTPAFYKPRALSADGSRVFFDSADALASGDSNNAVDVYEWEATGPACAKPAGCVSLLSSGRAEGGAGFADASLAGDDVFFVTGESLVGTDPGSLDLYDARVGGGYPEPLIPIPCFGDSCRSLPSEPTDPGLGTQVAGPGNPKVHYVKQGHAAKRKRCKPKSGSKKPQSCKKQAQGKGGRR